MPATPQAVAQPLIVQATATQRAVGSVADATLTASQQTFGFGFWVVGLGFGAWGFGGGFRVWNGLDFGGL